MQEPCMHACGQAHLTPECVNVEALAIGSHILGRGSDKDTACACPRGDDDSLNRAILSPMLTLRPTESRGDLFVIQHRRYSCISYGVKHSLQGSSPVRLPLMGQLTSADVSDGGNLTSCSLAYEAPQHGVKDWIGQTPRTYPSVWTVGMGPWYGPLHWPFWYSIYVPRCVMRFHTMANCISRTGKPFLQRGLQLLPGCSALATSEIKS